MQVHEEMANASSVLGGHFFGSRESVSEKYGIIFLGGMAETVQAWMDVNNTRIQNVQPLWKVS